MQKLKNLRQFILDKKLGTNADKLLTFVDSGKIVSKDDGYFELKYTARIILLNYHLPEDQIFYYLNIWFNAYEPDHKEGDLKFQSDILNHKETDFEFTLNLTELILVKEIPDGIDLIHCIEPKKEEPIFQKNWDLYVNGVICVGD